MMRVFLGLVVATAITTAAAAQGGGAMRCPGGKYCTNPQGQSQFFCNPAACERFKQGTLGRPAGKAAKK
jgi:hypothetical protein